MLRKPSCSTELVYKFAPGLVAASTEEVVDFFITAKPPLEARWVGCQEEARGCGQGHLFRSLCRGEETDNLLLIFGRARCFVCSCCDTTAVARGD